MTAGRARARKSRSGPPKAQKLMALTDQDSSSQIMYSVLIAIYESRCQNAVNRT